MARVALLTTLPEALAQRAVSLIGAERVDIIRDAAALRGAASSQTVLIGFHTGVVAPAPLLKCFLAAYNFHGATPDFPGRDPHHFAVYDGATTYGATAHVMTDRVDAGPILAVERFEVPPGASPRVLLSMAIEASLHLLEQLGPAMARGDHIAQHADEVWSGAKRTRAHFLAMCRIDPSMDAAEFERRVRAFDVEGYSNLFIELHGRRFGIKPLSE